MRNEVEVSCFPSQLPEFVEVDLAKLDVGQSLHLSDIKIPKGVELVELTKGSDHNYAVASIVAKRSEAEETSETTEEIKGNPEQE